MTTGFAIYNSPIGRYRVEYRAERLVGLHLLGDKLFGDEAQQRPTPFTEEVRRQIEEYFAAERTHFDLALDYSHSTEFQSRVYTELLKIPYGQTRSYKEVAEAIGQSRAVRAVGGANNRNPIAIIIPCHRVVGADGSLTGYAGGLDIKTFLLTLEKGTGMFYGLVGKNGV